MVQTALAPSAPTVPTCSKRRRRVLLATSVSVVLGVSSPAMADFLAGGTGLSSLGLGNVTSGLGGLTSSLGGLTGGSGSSGSSAGQGSALQGVQDQVQQFTGIVGSIQGQFDQLKSQIEQVISSMLSGANGAVSKAIKDALGALGLPDPQAVKDNLAKLSTDGSNKIDANNVSGISPSILKANQIASVSAQLWSQTALGKDAQTAAKADLSQLQQLLSQGSQTGQASTALANQSTQAASQSTQFASTAQTQAQQAQKRVSTQDAIKDLNLTAGTLAQQLGSLSTQAATQSGQLANITNVEAASLNVQGGISGKLTQTNIGIAQTVGQLSDVNDQLRGQDQARLAENVGAADQATQANTLAFRFLK